MKILRKIISVAAVAGISIMLLSPQSETVTAQGQVPGIIDNLSYIEGGKGGSTTGGVYFGNYKQSSNGSGGFNTDPIKWRVLENTSRDVDATDKRLFLLSDKNLDSVQYWFAYTGDYLNWSESTSRSWLNGYGASSNRESIDYSSDNFKNNALSTKEQAAIARTRLVTKETDEYWFNPDYDGYVEETEDQIFLLSRFDVFNTNYGFEDNIDEVVEFEENDELWENYSPSLTRISYTTDYAESRGAFVNRSRVDHFGWGDIYVGLGAWWLRSFQWATGATNVDRVGDLRYNDYSPTYRGVATRPALNLNLESVLFASKATGGKVSGSVGDGCLTAVSDNTTDEWKMTLLDDGSTGSVGTGHSDFACTATKSENTYKIDYTGAATGSNEYVSALIKDSTGTITYYGRIKAVGSSASGTATLDTTGKLNSGDTLYIFQEQYNGDKKTDYSSALIPLENNGNDVTPSISKRLLQNNNVATPDMTFNFTFTQKEQWDGVSYVSTDASTAAPIADKSVTITSGSEVLTSDEYVGDLTGKKLYQEKTGNVLSDFDPKTAGTYCYLVKEDNSNPIADVTYTESQFIMLVEVEDTGGGVLKPKTVTNILYKDSAGKTKDDYGTNYPRVFDEKQELIFYNTYGPGGGTTPTGIMTNILPFIVIGGVGAGGLALYAVLNVRRKRKEIS